MEFKDAILLLHPVIAIIVVFPLIGIVVHRAVQTRQRRLQTAAGEKSKLPPTSGPEHVQLGKWLAGSVVGIVLVAFANDVFGHIIQENVWGKAPARVILIGITFGVAIASLIFLYKAQERRWRGIFAVLTGISLIILGSQDGVYRKTEQWYISHYYYGMTAALLMIFSLAILREIYQDRTNRWRTTHIILNSVALIIFTCQAITGTQALLEVPLSWQKPYVQKLYKQHCDTNPCSIQQQSNF
jgi:Protein of unknown function (DUF4079)